MGLGAASSSVTCWTAWMCSPLSPTHRSGSGSGPQCLSPDPGRRWVGSQQVQKTIALTAEQGQQDTAHNSTEQPARAWQLLYNRFSVTYLFLLAFSFPASAFFQGNSGTCTSLKFEPPSISGFPKPTKQHNRTRWVIRLKSLKGKWLCLSFAGQCWRKCGSQHRR